MKVPFDKKQMQFLERLGCMYVSRYMHPLWHDRKAMDSRQALELFLEGYAFERQGRSPVYAPAAVDAVNKSHNLSAEQVWKNFGDSLDWQKLNKLNNPLYHTKSQCNCVIDGLKSTSGIRNIVADARNAIADGRVREIYEEVDAIRGIGPKIASFFLRDVALRFDIAPTNERALLQPIDVWVMRIVGHFDTNLSAEGEIQSWIVDHFDNPEMANAGMWYFASQVAGSNYEVGKALDDPKYARKLVESHVASLQAAVESWRHPAPFNNLHHGGMI
jgi:hypothetical protein